MTLKGSLEAGGSGSKGSVQGSPSLKRASQGRGKRAGEAEELKSRPSLRVGAFVGAEARGLRRIWEPKESRVTALSGRRVLEMKSE